MLPQSTPAERRILALVLPDLLCELALERRGATRQNEPFGVVLTSAKELPPARPRLAAVSHPAQARGVRPGQTIEEATATLAQLRVHEVSEGAVQNALGGIAEIALGFGQPASLQSPDTVWLDITQSAHLWGGERGLAEALIAQVRALGHQVRLAVAPGPTLAQAFARWGEPSRDGILLVPSELTAKRFEALPLLGLPLSTEAIEWFARLGVLSVGQLRALPASSVTARLGRDAPRLLELCAGRDKAPLVPHQPAPMLVEEVHWEDAVEGGEPLFFALKGLSARLSARLEGRGQAARQLWLELDYDRAWARLQRLSPRPKEGREATPECPGLRLKFALASPLWRETEIERVGRTRLERLKWGAPVVALRWIAPTLTKAPIRQQELGRWKWMPDAAAWGTLRGAAPEALAILLAELAADVGHEQVGRLRWVLRHRPEASSQLEPVSSLQDRPEKAAWGPQSALPPPPGSFEGTTRFLPNPVPFPAPLRVGELVGIGGRVFLIQGIRFEKRLEAVEWWTTEPTSRDYHRVWLTDVDGGFEAFVFVDRQSGQRYLQAILD